MQHQQTTPPPEMRKIGLFGAQPVELHTGTGEIYIGSRKEGDLGTVLWQRGKEISLNVKTEVEEQHLANALVKDKLRLSKIGQGITIENRERFINTMTHLVANAKKRIHGKSEEDHFTRNEFDAVLDDVKLICQNGEH